MQSRPAGEPQYKGMLMRNKNEDRLMLKNIINKLKFISKLALI